MFIKAVAQTTVQVVAQKVVMLCVLWNFEEVINHFLLVQNGAEMNAELYSEQLDFPASMNRKHALLQHDNILEVHTAAPIKAKNHGPASRNCISSSSSI